MPKFREEDALRIRESCMCLNLRALARALTSRYDEALAPTSLRMTQFSLLAHVRALGGAPTPGALATAMALDQTTASRNLRLMYREGWLTARSIGRSKVVELTPAGEAKLEAAFPLWESVQGETTASFGGAETWTAVRRQMQRALAES